MNFRDLDVYLVYWLFTKLIVDTGNLIIDISDKASVLLDLFAFIFETYLRLKSQQFLFSKWTLALTSLILAFLGVFSGNFWFKITTMFFSMIVWGFEVKFLKRKDPFELAGKLGAIVGRIQDIITYTGLVLTPTIFISN